jgi:hypothetical protein
LIVDDYLELEGRFIGITKNNGVEFDPVYKPDPTRIFFFDMSATSFLVQMQQQRYPAWCYFYGINGTQLTAITNLY